MKKRRLFILIPLVFIGLLPLIIMFLWNQVAVDLFAFKTIGYWQALGLFILSRLLFGGFNFRRPGRSPFAEKGFGEKWLSMSDEEKSRMREEWEKRKNNCQDLK